MLPSSLRALRSAPVLLALVCCAAAVTLHAPARAAFMPVLTIDDARVKEGDSGTRQMVFRVHLSAPTEVMVHVDVQTFDGTATVADHDYQPLSLHFSIPDQSTVDSFSVVVNGDINLEGNEWFRVRLSHPDGAVLGDDEAIGTIVNDERAIFHGIGSGFTPYFGGTLANSWGDYDGDGHPDLPLFHSNGDGSFTQIPGFGALLDLGNYHGVSWCDFDRDGDLDVVLLGYSGPDDDGEGVTPTRLLRNDGPAGFVDLAPALGMNIVGSGETAVWADFDGDGWPDLFTPYYSHIYPFQSFLYHNQRDGTFQERAAAAGVSLPGLPIELRPEGAQAADWNNDGHTDLYCASHLFINDGTGNFTDVRASVGLPVVFDEGASLVDFDNDGDLDLYLRSVTGPRLFRNDAGQFTEVTAASGLPAMELLWGDSWADVDGDGDLDLLLVPDEGYDMLMLNQGDGTFERDTLFDQLEVQPSLTAWADVDGDGDLDLATTNGYYKHIYINRQQHDGSYDGQHLSVRVVDAQGHETCHGATVRLTELGGPPGTIQTRVVDGGSGYLGQNEYTVHFGGVGSGRYALEVVYPSPAGTRVVVDSLDSPLLAHVEPDTVAQVWLTVHRDGVVGRTIQPSLVQVAGAPAPGPELAARLDPPSPVPARRAVTLGVRMARAGSVTLTIHDLSGRRVRSLEAGERSAGASPVVWDLTNDAGAAVPNGVYFCRLLVDGAPVGTQRVLVLR